VLESLAVDGFLSAYPGKVAVGCHAQQSAQVVIGVLTGVPRLGLEAAAKALSDSVHPLTQLFHRFARQTPRTAQVFLVDSFCYST
jgi:hypothetical protein